MYKLNNKFLLSFLLTATAVPFAYAQTVPDADQGVPAKVTEVSNPETSGGVITFLGEITAPTCVVNGGNGGENFEVTLPKVASSDLRELGKTAGATKFNIALSNCGYIGGKVRANFQEGGNVDVRTGRLVLQDVDGGSAAKNVQVELANESGEAINISGSDQTTAYFPIDDNGSSNLSYVARYYATGRSEAGLVRSQVTYVLQYD